MSDRTRESTAIPPRLSTTVVALGSAVAVLLGALTIAPTLGAPGAVATVGLVLAEAIVLYVGYGAVTRLASPILRETLESD